MLELKVCATTSSLFLLLLLAVILLIIFIIAIFKTVSHSVILASLKLAIAMAP